MADEVEPLHVYLLTVGYFDEEFVDVGIFSTVDRAKEAAPAGLGWEVETPDVWKAYDPQRRVPWWIEGHVLDRPTHTPI